MKEDIMHFYTIEELQSYLGNNLKTLKKKSEEYSEIIGEKIRFENAPSNSLEFDELKEKIEGSSDPKKKKVVKKKDQKTNWYDLGAISLYDGIGPRGELEIYFKALEKIKTKIEKIEKIKESIDSMISKGVKRELGCVTLLNQDLGFQISFVKAGKPKTKFSYKSAFTIPSEVIHEIKV